MTMYHVSSPQAAQQKFQELTRGYPAAIVKTLSEEECQKLVDLDTSKRAEYTVSEGYLVEREEKKDWVVVSDRYEREAAKASQINRILATLATELYHERSIREWMHFVALPEQLNTLEAIATAIVTYRTQELES
jgi:hypothetical protein